MNFYIMQQLQGNTKKAELQLDQDTMYKQKHTRSSNSRTDRPRLNIGLLLLPLRLKYL